jgi:hypothetical protein
MLTMNCVTHTAEWTEGECLFFEISMKKCRLKNSDAGLEINTRSVVGICRRGGAQLATKEMHIKGVLPWSAESPTIYTLVVTLDDGRGHEVRCAFSAENYTRGCHWFPRFNRAGV